MTPGREGACVGERKQLVCVCESVCVCVCYTPLILQILIQILATSGWRVNAPGGITIRIS